MAKSNSPGAPTNPPQHTADERPLPLGGDTDHTAWKHKPTGADPHPSTEEHYDRERHPGGAHPPDEARDCGPNDAVHHGTAEPRPRNAENSR